MRIGALWFPLAVAATAGDVAAENEPTCLSEQDDLASAFQDPAEAFDLLQRSGAILRGAAKRGVTRDLDSVNTAIAAAFASSSPAAPAELEDVQELWRSAAAQKMKVRATSGDVRPGEGRAAAAKPWELMCNEWSSGLSKRGATWDCPRGLTCTCSRFSPKDGRWHCSEEETKRPCAANVPAPPTAYPTKVFFAAFKADVANLAAGALTSGTPPAGGSSTP